MRDLDRAIFHWINHWPDGLRGTMWFFSEATTMQWVKAVLGLLSLGMLIANRLTRKTIVEALLAFPLANGLTDVLKHVFQSPRPYQPAAEMADVIHRLGAANSFGTASAHSANMAAIAFVFTYYLRGWGVPWIAVALLTGLSRIYNGDHFPYQVLVGWSCGIFAALVVIKTWEAFLAARARSTKNQKSSENAGDRP